MKEVLSIQLMSDKSICAYNAYVNAHILKNETIFALYSYIILRAELHSIFLEGRANVKYLLVMQRWIVSC